MVIESLRYQCDACGRTATQVSEPNESIINHRPNGWVLYVEYAERDDVRHFCSRDCMLRAFPRPL